MSRTARAWRLAALALHFAGGGAPEVRASDTAPTAASVSEASAGGALADARGDELLLAGDLAAAAAAYRQAIELNLGSAATHAKLGRVELWRGERRAAQSALQRALELDPAHAEAHFLLGAVYDERGFDRRARQEYRRAFELEPALTDPLRHPEVARHRQALAALLVLWHDELDADPAGAATGAGSFAAAARSTVLAPAPARSRATARSTPRPAPGAKADVVIDASDLRARGAVNQLPSSGQAAGGRSRLPSATRTPTRYTPPPPPPAEPEPEPEPEDLEALEEEEAAEEEEEPPPPEEEPPPSGF